MFKTVILLTNPTVVMAKKSITHHTITWLYSNVSEGYGGVIFPTYRFQAICLPMKAHASASSKRSIMICLSIWVLAGLLNIPVGQFWVGMILCQLSTKIYVHRSAIDLSKGPL